VRLAQQRLADLHHLPFVDAQSRADNEQLEQKLQLANAAMQKMAVLLERVMSAHEPDQYVLASKQTLGAFVPDLIASLQPKAGEHHVTINLHMTTEAASAPAGLLGTVLLNGLTNAIDACAASPNMPRVIEVSIAINCHSELIVLISDTGPGIIEQHRSGGEPIHATKEGGHGIGLKLCRQIVDELGGQMNLMNIPFGAGAIFHVRVPLNRLRAAA
jgi:signal transduction histidine kinase